MGRDSNARHGFPSTGGLAIRPASFRPMNIRAIETAISDRYRLGAEIGRGGMAAVYQAEDVRHGRSVAVKVLDPELISVAAERFLREIRFTGQLTHPHILPLLDSGEVD